MRVIGKPLVVQMTAIIGGIALPLHHQATRCHPVHQVTVRHANPPSPLRSILVCRAVVAVLTDCRGEGDTSALTNFVRGRNGAIGLGNVLRPAAALALEEAPRGGVSGSPFRRRTPPCCAGPAGQLVDDHDDHHQRQPYRVVVYLAAKTRRNRTCTPQSTPHQQQ